MFDIKRTSESNQYGKGHYFTTSIDDANKHYASKSENVNDNDTDTKIDNLAYDLFYQKGYSYEDSLTNDSEILEILNRSYELAEEYYSSNNARLISVYLNIKNPLYVKEGASVGSILDKVFVDKNQKIININKK